MTATKHKRKKRPPSVKTTPAECLQWLMDHLDYDGEGCLT